MRAFSSCGEQRLLLIAFHGLLSLRWLLLLQSMGCRAQASVVAAVVLSSCGSWAPEHRLSSCGAWAELLHGMWDLPGSGIELVSLALAGGFFTPEPPEMLHGLFFSCRRAFFANLQVFVISSCSVSCNFGIPIVRGELRTFLLCHLGHSPYFGLLFS